MTKAAKLERVAKHEALKAQIRDDRKKRARQSALQHAVAAGKQGFQVTGYHDGCNVTIIIGARVVGSQIVSQTLDREVSSPGIAKAVVARFGTDLNALTHLSPKEALEASVLYAEAAWTHANRRMGRMLS